MERRLFGALEQASVDMSVAGPILSRSRGARASLSAQAKARGAKPAGARISPPVVVGALILFDAANFPLSGLFAYLGAQPRPFAPGPLMASLACVTLIGLGTLLSRWTYTIRAIGGFVRPCFDLALAFFGALAVWSAACLLARADQSVSLRTFALLWFCSGLLAGAAVRAIFAIVVGLWTQRGLLARRTIIVGGGHGALETIRRLEQSAKGAVQIIGVFDDRNAARLPDGMANYRLLGSFDDLESFCRANAIDLLIVTIPARAETRLLEVLQKLWVLPVDVRISAVGGGVKFCDRAYNYIGDAPFLPVFDKAMSDRNAALKGIFDRLAAALLIVLLAPLLALVALGVRLSSPGPALFRQDRYGFNNEKFSVFKFRSMYADRCDVAANALVTRDDPRVTPLGAFIRRASLDELPQLFNVLLGDLSLVGPRPHAVKGKAAGMLYEQAVAGYFARHRVKPGITGWAQINGWRGETDTIEKIERRMAYDLDYIDHWSIWFDLKILALTPFAVLWGKNAY
jgi:Undecaprenyl-phosphate glucose phosphotransferase